jgi:hypothetical protein
MRIKLLLIALVFFYNISFSQWSASTYADSALYVCPGFYPGLVTFEDGSSIVLGILSSYIFAQKLDPYGYKVWDEPVIVHYNDSSNMSVSGNLEWFCSDGDGGVIVFWQDYRGAYSECYEPLCYWFNNTTYIQRIDKNGNKRWEENGIIVSGLQDGLKETRITPDGEGGCVLLLSELGFEYPDAPNKNYLKITRYNAKGEMLWQTVLDSSFNAEVGFQLYNIYRGGDYYYFNYLMNENYKKTIRKDGDINTYRELQIALTTPSPDGNFVFFNHYSPIDDISIISKINFSSDTLWSKSISYENFCGNTGGGGFLPDNRGGTYLTHICSDTIIYFDSIGNLFLKKIEGIHLGQYKYFDGLNGIIVANDTIARRFDSAGTPLWGNGVTYLSDPENSYHELIRPDNNGGLIVTFWTTFGGIFAQHTGRNGSVGIITDIKEITDIAPENFELYQNYPNPFNPTTTIKFSVKEPSIVKITITDILGQKITDLTNEEMNPGTYEIQWNAGSYSSGVYFYSLYINNKIVSAKKLLLAK